MPTPSPSPSSSPSAPSGEGYNADAAAMDAELDAELCGHVRRFAREITGGNCAFADDDLRVLAHLANRAVEAGLIDGLHPLTQAKINAAKATGAA